MKKKEIISSVLHRSELFILVYRDGVFVSSLFWTLSALCVFSVWISIQNYTYFTKQIWKAIKIILTLQLDGIHFGFGEFAMNDALKKMVFATAPLTKIPFNDWFIYFESVESKIVLNVWICRSLEKSNCASRVNDWSVTIGCICKASKISLFH